VSGVVPAIVPASRLEVTESRPRHRRCPACDQGDLETFFEVAQSPIVCNVLCPTLEAALAVPRAPIHLGFCLSCGHVYNTAFDTALLQYDAKYENSLQFSNGFRAYQDGVAQALVQRYGLRGKDIIEIGCGQGDFLSLLCRLGGNRGLGFDPSFDPEKLDTALAGDVKILSQLYSHEHASRPVDLMCCRHVLEHLPHPLEFLREIRRTIGDRSETVLFFEVPNALFTLERLGIWDIIYEHCSYFTPSSLQRVFELAGFEVRAINQVYDGQFLTIEAQPAFGSAAPVASRVSSSVVESVARFDAEYRAKAALWRERLHEIERRGTRAVVWGAGSKG
jgi:SAM-dependent methyltransferase